MAVITPPLPQEEKKPINQFQLHIIIPLDRSENQEGTGGAIQVCFECDHDVYLSFWFVEEWGMKCETPACRWNGVIERVGMGRK